MLWLFEEQQFAAYQSHLSLFSNSFLSRRIRYPLFSCKRPNYDFFVSQSSVATVLKWCGHNNGLALAGEEGLAASHEDLTSNSSIISRQRRDLKKTLLSQIDQIAQRQKYVLMQLACDWHNLELLHYPTPFSKSWRNLAYCQLSSNWSSHMERSSFLIPCSLSAYRKFHFT